MVQLAGSTMETYAGTAISYAQGQQSLRKVAVHMFQSAHRQGQLRSLMAKVKGQSTRLIACEKVDRNKRFVEQVRAVALDAIIGTEGRADDFDNDFWPLTSHSRDRWISIAVALQQGIGLPPVTLVSTENGYIVRDGHHRISVARAIGMTMIDAEVV